MCKKVLCFLMLVLTGCTQVRYNWAIFYHPGSWSPDCKWIYYFKTFELTRVEKPWAPYSKEVISWDDRYFIGKCRPDGSDTTTLLELSEAPHGVLDVSPDGWIIFSTRSGIWMVDTSGENLHRIWDWGMYPRWAFNYTKIIFSGPTEYDSGYGRADTVNPGIWLINRDGRGLEKIMDEGTRPAFCDANGKIVYILNGDLIIYSFADSSKDSIGTTYAGAPDWNVAGDSIVFLRGENPYVFSVASYHYTQIPFVALGSGGDVRWKPGAWIIGGSNWICSINIDGKTSTILSSLHGEGEHP